MIPKCPTIHDRTRRILTCIGGQMYSIDLGVEYTSLHYREATLTRLPLNPIIRCFARDGDVVGVGFL